MSFFDRMFGRRTPAMASLPREITRHSIPHISVRMAEDIIIIDADRRAGALLADASSARSPIQLSSPDARPVAFVPVTKPTRPVLDPRHGWVIPVDETLATQFSALKEAPGEHQFNEWLVLGLE